MSILGLEDPWIIAAYAGCILSVVFCVYYSLKKGAPEEEEDSDD
ncbi:hypothetical protein AUP07_0804 [methanogenic archaeon mixed culture ISO4-G1]|nr:hypothetical protein AUP07_0804 [methanogenic archaeon mixed culture ISO4-G1]